MFPSVKRKVAQVATAVSTYAMGAVKSTAGVVGLVGGLAFGANDPVFAQTAATIDITAVTTALGTAGTALAGVGVAIISALVIAVGYKWVKGMMFG